MEDVQNDFCIIPDNCLEKILDHLPVSALLNAEKVCWRWKNLCKNVWKLKRELNFTNDFDYDDYELVLLKCGKFITSLHVTANISHEGKCNNAKSCLENSSKIIIPVGFYCKILEHLSLKNLCQVDLNTLNFLSHCASPRLVSLHIKGGNMKANGLHSLNMILRQSTNLKSLSLILEIDFPKYFYDDIQLEISNKCKYLNINKSRIRDALTVDILKTLTNLETLKVAAVNMMIEPLISQFSTLYPNLKELNLSGISDLTDLHLNQLLLLPNLNYLKVNDLETVTSGTVVSFAETFQNQLELFHCAGCNYVTNAAFVRMIELCPKLRSLNVRDCNLITSTILVEASFALRERKSKIPLKIKTTLKHKDFPESRKKILKTGIHPLLIVKYY